MCRDRFILKKHYLTIAGKNRAETILNGDKVYRLFHILQSNDGGKPNVTLQHLTLTQGPVGQKGSVIFNAGNLFLDNVWIANAGEKSDAIFNQSGNLTLDNGSLTTNSRGIYSERGTLEIKHSEFTAHNSRQYGAAVFSNRGSTSISSSLFKSNTSKKKGGALYLMDYRNAHLAGNTFDSNQSRADGGAVAIATPGMITVTVENCVFTNNESRGQGGALYAQGSDLFIKKTVLVTIHHGKTVGLFQSIKELCSSRIRLL